MSSVPGYRLPSPLQDPPVILFRAASQSFGPPSDDLDLVSRGPHRPISWEAFDDCLSWRQVATPFIPFTRSWNKVLNRRELLVRNGQQDVMIMAIWSEGLRNVYDAHDVAKELGYHSPSWDRRRQLDYHLDEYLVAGGIYSDDYRILAIFHGRTLDYVSLGVPGLIGQAEVPSGLLADGIGGTLEEKLENEIYQHTGIQGRSRKLMYLIGSMICAFDRPGTSFVVT